MMRGLSGARTSIAPAGRQSGLACLFDAIEEKLETERDQILLWLPVAFGLGIATWCGLADRNGWIAFILTMTALGVAALAFGRDRRVLRGIGIFALVTAIGCALIWLRAEYKATDTLERPVVSRFIAEIVSIEHLPARENVRVLVKNPSNPDLPTRFRVNLAEDMVPEGLGVGAWIALNARLMPPPRATVPGSYDFAQRAWFEGIGATGRAWGRSISSVRPAPAIGVAGSKRDALISPPMSRSGSETGKGLSRRPSRPVIVDGLPRKMPRRCGEAALLICLRSAVCM